MLFHTFPFFLLYTITAVAYWSMKDEPKRVWWLVLASIVFYAKWNPWLVSVVLFTAAFDFYIAQRIEAATSVRRRKFLLVTSLLVSLSLLAFFKYTNFLIDNGRLMLNLFGLELSGTTLKVVIPLGISFYTFETISYVVDVYLGRIKAERNGSNYALFLLFFPHLIAGPIVRAGHFLPQVRRRKFLNWERVQVGARLFLLGLFKKVVIADQLATLIDPVFANPGSWSSATTWVAVICYAVQIYCDFSGYSDMAIGAAHGLGYHLPENFNMPYFSLNIAQFWQRWHISLSTWVRDYLYIPLGGNRYGTFKTYRNLMITMLLCGLWHGAGWTFVFWGFYHGFLLAVHRAVPWPSWLGKKILIPFRWATTFLLVCIGWVFFRAQNFSNALMMLRRMFIPTEGLVLTTHVAMLATGVLALVFLAHVLGAMVDWRKLEWPIAFPLVAAGMVAGFLLVQILMPANGGAFIYFQF
ncbi:putative alginate O-acetylase AlgI [Syntrophobacter sp. SbD1]|nr:putative alginate O-acetylase AlgI [Syntrophobacter sp. SbD1]